MQPRFRKAVAALFASLLLTAASVTAQAWWSDEWRQRKAIEIRAEDYAAIANATVLLRLHAGNFPQFLLAAEQGKDWRFVAADDRTVLPHFVERFDAVAQMAFVWVRVPTLRRDGPTRLWLYFDNPAAAPSAAPPVDEHVLADFHFADESALTADAAGRGARIDGQSVALPASAIGGGLLLPGTAPSVVVLPGGSQTATSWTIEAWLRIDTPPSAAFKVLARGDDLTLSVADGRLTLASAQQRIAADTPFPVQTWTHVALVGAADGIALFQDGALRGRLEETFALGDAWSLGDAGGALQVDELRVSDIARPPAQLAWAAAIEGPRHDEHVVYGVDETVAAAVTEVAAPQGIRAIVDYVFGRRDTLVEQAVIGICGVMAIVALLVIAMKFLQLRRWQRASREFLADYGRQREAGTADLPPRRALASPLYELYEAGRAELARCRALPARRSREQTLALLRGRLDATALRAAERMNATLVLLTVAISGGPFIGLLGTVIGVMTTFGAIAAAGDVNIAAIAPGMAAALLATVAGLGVAIPALFGYNYLGSQVQSLVVEMQAFAEEYLADVDASLDA